MTGKLSAIDCIKLIMLFAMTVGHFAWAFVPTDSIWSDILHFFGRITLPLACFLVVLGVQKTHNLLAYIGRMMAFAVLAQLPFIAMQVPIDTIIQTPLIVLYYGNVLFNLAIGIAALIVWQLAYYPPNSTFNHPIGTLDNLINDNLIKNNLIKNSSINDKAFLWQLAQLSHCLPVVVWQACLLMALVVMAVIASRLDWGILVMVWVVALYEWGVVGFVAVAVLCLALSAVFLADWLPLKADNPMDYGVFLALPVMYWYYAHQHTKARYRLPRTLFYWYYVLHMALIAVLVYWFKLA